MRFNKKLVMGGAIFLLGAAAAALAQEAIGPKPDPTHIPFYLPANIPWVTDPAKPGEQTYSLFGDQHKPGPYAMLVKWFPGNYSKPHFHAKTRYITVISGHWWVSSSNVYDPRKTYPIPPGSIVQDVAHMVHWDGAKNEVTVLEIVGDGPVPNIPVDPQGKVIPPK